jgi:hypothetical protein
MNFIGRMDRVKSNDFNRLGAESPSSRQKEGTSTTVAVEFK